MVGVKITVIEGEAVQCEAVLSGVVEVGRQWNTYEDLYAAGRTDDAGWRLPVARTHEVGVRRRHALIEAAAGGRVALTNLDPQRPLNLEGEPALAGGERREVALPVCVCLAATCVLRLEAPGAAPDPAAVRTRGAGRSNRPEAARAQAPEVPGLLLEVYEGRELKDAATFDGPVELGRQASRDEALYVRCREGDRWRWVIARRDETTVSRKQVLLSPLPNGAVRVTNCGTRQPIRFLDASELAVNETRDLPLPVQIVLSPTKTVRAQKPAALNSLPEVTIPPSRAAARGKGARLPTLVGPGDLVRRDDLLEWLNLAGELLQSSAGSADYFEIAARTAVETVDLDAARLLLRENGRWQTRGRATDGRTDPGSLPRPSERVLDRVLTERKTFWEWPGAADQESESLAGVEMVVAAPLLDQSGEVIGAVYGERTRGARPGQPGIGAVEARLVELIARIVAGGLARLEEERKAASAESTFEQFFGRELAVQLRANPLMLEGHDREVSVLFCDIRWFSRLSERLGASRTIQWCRDVLGRMSECVLAEGGVVVDYVGDGLMAMWGAPDHQPDHAARACRTALAMLAALPEIDRQWEGVLGERIGVGIGINTGMAQVGNVGSLHKFKYGALGSAVNVASRVQGATKYFRCPLILTGATQSQLPAEAFLTRRLGRVRLVGIEAPVTLYQLLDPGWGPARQAKAAYEAALEQFENGDFSTGARSLSNWHGLCPEDDAVLLLMVRCVNAMVHGVSAAHPVIEFTDK